MTGLVPVIHADPLQSQTGLANFRREAQSSMTEGLNRVDDRDKPGHDGGPGGGAESMPKAPEIVPAFSNETEEREFWEKTDSVDLIDWGKAERVRLPALEPSKRTISIRLPLSLLERLKVAAHKRDVPYQSLIKIWLAERLEIPD